MQLERPGHDRRFSSANDARCPESGNKDYHLLVDNDGNLHLEDGRGNALADVEALPAVPDSSCGCSEKAS